MNEASTFYKRLAYLLASKWDHPYSSTLCWLRCSLAFSLLRSAIQSIRGARSSCGHAIRTPTAVDLLNAESNISPDVNTNLSLSFFFLYISYLSIMTLLFIFWSFVNSGHPTTLYKGQFSRSQSYANNTQRPRFSGHSS